MHTGKDVNLLELPILKTWPGDGGRYITLPLVMTKDPKAASATPACTACRSTTSAPPACTGSARRTRRSTCASACASAAVTDADRVNLMAMTGGGTMAATTTEGLPTVTLNKIRGERMEVAVAIGTDPAMTFSAIVPAPPEIEEFLIAGFLRQAPVELVQCETVDLQVPAHAEYILEGYVEIGELRSEGPFGDHTGFYTMPDDYPVFHLTAITHRKNPIYAATVVGKPPMEDAWMGKAVERIFLPLMRLTIPEIVDINLPAEGVFHNLMIVQHSQELRGPGTQGDERHLVAGPGHVHQVHHRCRRGLRRAGRGEVTLRTANNIDPERDIQFTLGPVDSLGSRIAAA